MKFLFDTNILIAAMNGTSGIVSRLDALTPDDEALLPAVVLAELRYGALSSARVAENLARIEKLAARLAFSPVDRGVAERFADVKADLRRRGLVKADADLLIAATALHSGAVLVTHDAALLDGAIAQLAVEDWLAT